MLTEKSTDELIQELLRRSVTDDQYRRLREGWHDRRWCDFRVGAEETTRRQLLDHLVEKKCVVSERWNRDIISVAVNIYADEPLDDPNNWLFVNEHKGAKTVAHLETSYRDSPRLAESEAWNYELESLAGAKTPLRQLMRGASMMFTQHNISEAAVGPTISISWTNELKCDSPQMQAEMVRNLEKFYDIKPQGPLRAHHRFLLPSHDSSAFGSVDSHGDRRPRV